MFLWNLRQNFWWRVAVVSVAAFLGTEPQNLLGWEFLSHLLVVTCNGVQPTSFTFHLGTTQRMEQNPLLRLCHMHRTPPSSLKKDHQRLFFLLKFERKPPLRERKQLERCCWNQSLILVVLWRHVVKRVKHNVNNTLLSLHNFKKLKLWEMNFNEIEKWSGLSLYRSNKLLNDVKRIVEWDNKFLT